MYACLHQLIIIAFRSVCKISLLSALIGAVSDGEFNSLRTQGATRPVHLWQLIHDMRESVNKQKKETLLRMLVKIGGK